MSYYKENKGSNRVRGTRKVHDNLVSEVVIIGKTDRARFLAELAEKASTKCTLLHCDNRQCDSDDTGFRWTNDFELIRNKPFVLYACCRSELDSMLEHSAPCLSGDQMIFHCVSGLSSDERGLQTPSQRIMELTCVKRIAVLWGYCPEAPNVTEQPSAWAVSSPFHEGITAANKLFTSTVFRLYENEDVPGTEVGAALVPAYALACGVACGLGYEAPAIGLLVTRAVAEMARLGAVMGGDPATFSGLSGLGALVGEGVAQSSAFFTLGKDLASGDCSFDSIETGSVAGNEDRISMFNTVAEVTRFVRRNSIPMPLLCAVEALLAEKKSPEKIARDLLSMEVGREKDFSVNPGALELPLPAVAPRGGPGKL